jgi:hypothetical protein
MPNTIQIRGSQIQSETIEASNINLSGSFDFRAASSFIAATPSASDDVATKGYVDSQIADGFQAGDGIDIDTATSPDTVSVKLAASNPALQFVGTGTDELQVKFNATFFETGAGGLDLVAASIGETQLANAAVTTAKIGDAQVTNAKLAGSIANDKLSNSTISGVSLGSNLNSLAASGTGGITLTSYNGSAAVSDLAVNLDGATLSVGASGLKIADGGVGSTQIADNAVIAAKIASSAVETAKINDGAVTTAKIANNAVDDTKISFEGAFDVFSPDGSTAAFNLSSQYLNGFEPQVMAFKNGLLMRLVASGPADADQYTVTDNGSVSTVTFGANLSASDTLEVRYIAQK